MFINFVRKDLFNVYFAEDSGNSGGASTAESNQDSELNGDNGNEGSVQVDDEQVDSPQDDGENEETAPSYFSQFPKDKAESEGYKSLYRYKSIAELADALIAKSSELDGMKKGMERTLKVPEKGDKEGIELFAQKLGVPMNPDDYDFESLSALEKEAPEIVSAVKKGCKRMMLTGKQGKGVAEMISGVMNAAFLRSELEINRAVKNQAVSVASSYSDMQSDKDRAKAAEVDINRYNSFLKETGLDSIIPKSSLAGNPKLIRAISSYVGKYGRIQNPGNSANTAGGATNPHEGFMGQPYSKDFQNFIKGNN